MSDNEDRKRPTVKLTGAESNAFMVLGLCRRAAVRAEWSKCDWEAFMTKAQDGDYDHLLRTVMEHFDVI